MNAAPKTLATCPNSSEAGLHSTPRRQARRAGARRRAICGRDHAGDGRIDRPGRSARSDRAPVRARSRPNSTHARGDAPIRSATDAHSPVEGIVHRYPDRVLLKLTHVCAVYCRFCFRREMIGPRRTAADAEAARRRARLHRRASGNLGGRADRRRSAGAVARAGCSRWCRGSPRIAARQGDPRAHPRAGRRPGAHHARAGARAEGAGQGDLRRAARQPRARTDRRRARGLRAPGRCRHSDAEPVGAARRRQRRSADARRADARAGRMPHQAVLPAPRRSRARHVASAHLDRARPGADAGAARPPVRPVPADLRARHSRRPRQVADRPELPVARRARAASGSRTSTERCIAIRRPT